MSGSEEQDFGGDWRAVAANLLREALRTSNLPLREKLHSAATTAQADYAALLILTRQKLWMALSYNIDPFTSEINWDFDSAGYDPASVLVRNDLQPNEYIARGFRKLSGATITSLARFPVHVEGAPFFVALVVYRMREMSNGKARWPSATARITLNKLALSFAADLAKPAAQAVDAAIAAGANAPQLFAHHGSTALSGFAERPTSAPSNHVHKPQKPAASAAQSNSENCAFSLFCELASCDNIASQLARLVRVAALACGADVGSVSVTSPTKMAVLGAFNMKARTLIQPWDFQRAGYGHDAFFQATNIERGSYLSKRARQICGLDLTAFVRVPIVVKHPTLNVSLVVGLTRPSDTVAEGWLPAKARRMLDEVAFLIGHLLESITVLATARSRHSARSSDLIRGLSNASCPAALLDQEHRCIACNDLFRVAVGVDIDPIGLLFPNLHVGRFPPGLYAGTTQRRGNSLDVIDERDDQAGKNWSVSWAQIEPADRREPLFFVTLKDGVHDDAVRDGMESFLSSVGHAEKNEPTFEFLRKTLPARIAIRNRKAISYLTVRTWRKSIKAYQIDALRSLKDGASPGTIRTIAVEIDAAVEQILGFGSFGAIVPMPGGHSGRQTGFSVRLAKALAIRRKLPMVEALALPPHPGSSHPKENTRRPAMHIAKRIDDAVLLVDDVATSGRHIEEAVTLLRRTASAVFAVAWIGGETSD